MILFDIETAPRPEDEIADLLPEFDDSKHKHPGTFNPLDVKLGNIKDESKKAEKIEKCRNEHQEKLEKYETDLANAIVQHKADQLSRAALSAITGRIIAIGVYDPTRKRTAIIHNDESEAEMLINWWTIYDQGRSKGEAFVGYNIAGFDVPFLIQRSRILGVDVPRGIYDRTGKYLQEHFRDLMTIWSCGVYGANVKLDLVAKALGVGGKMTGEDGKPITGKDFAKLWFGGEESRAKAIEYLTNDLLMTAGVAAKLGFN